MGNSNALDANKKQYKKAVQGLAVIKTGKNKARITFDEPKNHFEDTGSNVKEFSLDELPASPTIPTNTEDHYFVKLERKDGCDVEYVGPADGVYPGKVLDLSRPEKDSDPAPYTIKPEEFPEYEAFNIYYKITGGDFKGCTVSEFFHYKFVESDNNQGFAAWDGDPSNSKAKWLPKLIERCTQLDIVAEPIEWPEDGNVLPELLSRMLADPKTLQLVIKNGYVSEVVVSGRSTRVVSDEEDVAPRKKPAPVSKGKAPAPKASRGKKAEAF